MRRLERGAGRKVGTGDAVPNSGSRRLVIPGLGLGRRPRVSLASSHSGGVGAPPGGTKASCRSWLTAARKRAAESAARRRKENAAAERRKARRRAYPAGDLRRSGDRLDREAGHRVRRSAPAPVGALLPLIFGGAEKDNGAARAPQQAGGGALPC